MNRILVVDDDQVNLIVTRGILKTHYEVECVSSGPEALAFLREEMPELVLLDLHMPDMDGYEVLAEIKKSPETADLPVIFLTADDDTETEVKVFQAGAMDYIKKPFSAQVAIQRIDRILELRRLQTGLEQEVEKKTAELLLSNRKVANLSYQIMEAMSAAIDAKDRYTHGHSDRVAQYSRELAKRLGKTGQELVDIYYIALLHDVGKIGVPNEIINKPDRLTDEEFAVIKTHPGMGASILENISEMPQLSVGAHWHHERYDGTGYPDGLRGTGIPEIARIIGVADSYDAMSSNRSYRRALPQEVIIGELEKGKGTQFDPEIAELMIRMIREDTNYDMREK